MSFAEVIHSVYIQLTYGVSDVLARSLGSLYCDLMFANRWQQTEFPDPCNTHANEGQGERAFRIAEYGTGVSKY